MSRVLTPFRVEASVWLVLFLGLLLGVGLVTDWGRRWHWPLVQNEAVPASVALPRLTEPFRMLPPDKFIDISLRPLFVVTRRPAPIPPPPEPPQPPKPAMRKNQFILTGTTIVAEGRFAHLVEKAGNKSRVVAEGKEIDGILVKEVKPDWVILTQYEDTEKLILQTAKAPPVSSAVPNPNGATISPGIVRRHAWPEDLLKAKENPAGSQEGNR